MIKSSNENNYEDYNDDDEDDQIGSISDVDGLKVDQNFQIGDFQFGDTEIDLLSADHDQSDCIGLQMDTQIVEENNDWELPTESISPRHEISYNPIENDDPCLSCSDSTPKKLSKD